MRLDQFVAEALEEIAQGVKTAQAAVGELGGQVNPYRSWEESVQQVDFDVEVSTETGTATKGGLGIFVGAIGVGTQGESESATSSVGRIRFKIPLELPTPPKNDGAGGM